MAHHGEPLATSPGYIAITTGFHGVPSLVVIVRNILPPFAVIVNLDGKEFGK